MRREGVQDWDGSVRGRLWPFWSVFEREDLAPVAVEHPIRRFGLVVIVGVG